MTEDPVVKRAFYRKAIEILDQLVPNCADETATQQWIISANEVVSWVLGKPTKFKLCGNWSDGLLRTPGAGIPYATIHEAKGKAYDAKCLAVDIDKDNDDVIGDWEIADRPRHCGYYTWA